MYRLKNGLLSAVVVLSVSADTLCGGEARVVSESARKVPVAYNVDVVVVGGSTGAVSAAVAAAKAGAGVFLAAPRPYLGEDLCATLHLWLEPGEQPKSLLTKAIFNDPLAGAAGKPKNLLRFTYRADQPSAGRHQDTNPPSVLADGRWFDATRQSVQYDTDVAITLDLGERRGVRDVRLLAFHRREGREDFDVGTVTVAASDDKAAWKRPAQLTGSTPQQGIRTFSAHVAADARYLRLKVTRADGLKRVLLGEIQVVAADDKGSPPREAPRVLVSPMHVKRVLDDALLDAGVKFLFGCYATDVLRDAAGRPAGIVMANRAGQQAVIAKTIIDATDRAWVARMAGAEARPWPAGPQILKRVVIGGTRREGEGLTARTIPPGYTRAVRRRGRQTFEVTEYTLSIPMDDGFFASWAEAEQIARDRTHQKGQQFASEVLFQVPPDPIIGRAAVTGEWRGVEALDLDAFRPKGVRRLFVLSGCADVPRDQAARILRPAALIDVGARLGAAAAADAKALPEPKGVHVPGREVATPAAPGDVREVLIGPRPFLDLPTIEQQAGGLPVLGAYDVVVVGGGTSGAPAAIGAARRGARVLVIEYLHGLGGVGTLGSITKYYHGYRGGFTREVGASSWSIEGRMAWWRGVLRDAKADIWFGTLGCGALVDDGTVRGAIVATPAGRGVVLADVVIDATGNTDVAAAAGAPCVYTDASQIAVQGTGLPYREFGASYVNTDFTFTDETDAVDTWHLFVYARRKYAQRFDLGQLIDTRERRRVVGDTTITVLDQLNGRTWPDTIAQTRSDFDSHGYTIDPLFELTHPGRKRILCHIPYRAILPTGLDGLLVIGLGLSAHRDALPAVRMQPDVQNTGYAAGCAAAMAAAYGVPTRKIDIRDLQKHLVAIGCLPEAVLKQKDSYPLPRERIEQAVKSVAHGYKGAAVILSHRDAALPLLREAYAKAETPEARLAYAHVLGVMGDATGVGTLIEAVKAAKAWDRGWNWRGMGQYGRALSPLDSLILALARTHDPRVVPVIVEKAGLLTERSHLSHCRAIGLAAAWLRDERLSAPIAKLLGRPGMMGHAVQSVVAQGPDDASLLKDTRQESLREIFLARGLYLCGDRDGLGERVLKAYRKDLRGHFARHAAAVLEGR